MYPTGLIMMMIIIIVFSGLVSDRINHARTFTSLENDSKNVICQACSISFCSSLA